MVNWFKFFTLGFFSDKMTAEAPRRKYYSPIAGLLLAFILFVCVIIAADFVPFSIHYKKAYDFNEMVHNAFAAESAARISLKVDGGKLTAERNGGGFVNGKLVNSFTEETDKMYSVNGYNLVVDTRPMTSYDAFEAEFDGGKVTESEYSSLSYSAKKNCPVKIVFTDEIRVLDAAFMSECNAYLEKVSTPTDQNYEQSVAEKYAGLKNSEKEQDELNSDIYKLWLQAFYPQTFGENSAIPILRNYYAGNYMENENVKNYLFVFEDMLVGSFDASNGVSRMFYGYTSGLADGTVVTAQNSAEAEKQIDSFINKAYRDSLGISSYLYFINARRIFLITIILWLAYALVAFGVARLLKSGLPHKFGAWFKITGSFIFVSAFVTSVISFICGFFASPNTCFSIIVPLFAGILFVRLAAYVLTSYLRGRKSVDETTVLSEDIRTDEERTENIGTENIDDVFNGDFQN